MSEAVQKLEHIELPVALPDRTVSEKEAIEAFRRQGFIDMPETSIRDLEAVGIHVKGVGVLKIQRGRIMMNAQRRAIAMSQISAVLTGIALDPKDKRKVDKVSKLATALAQLSRADSEDIRLAVEIEGLVAPGGAPPEEPEPENRGFVVGQAVRARPSGTTIVARDVHVHAGNSR